MKMPKSQLLIAWGISSGATKNSMFSLGLVHADVVIAAFGGRLYSAKH